MDIKVEAGEFEHLNGQSVPLLHRTQEEEANEKSLIAKAISQTYQSTAHLANLLPTGTVLAFQLLSPILSNQGDCDPASRLITAIFVALCGLSCFLLSFTDSFKDKDGHVCYVFATYGGSWVIDGSATLPADLATNYRLKFIDFMHGFMSLLVFAAVALFDEHVVNCFAPKPSDETKELLASLPVLIGVVCSMLFVVFPTQRHGIGFQVSSSAEPAGVEQYDSDKQSFSLKHYGNPGNSTPSRRVTKMNLVRKSDLLMEDFLRLNLINCAIIRLAL